MLRTTTTIPKFCLLALLLLLFCVGSEAVSVRRLLWGARLESVLFLVCTS